MFLILSCTFTASAQWGKPVKEKKGVKVYTKDGKFSVKDAKGVVTIKTTLDDILELLRDYDNYPKWMYRCSEAKMLKKVSDTEFYVYSVTDAPMPVSDRDLVVHVKGYEDEKGGGTLKMTGAADYIPTKKGRVRVPQFSGSWEVKPNGDGTMEVTYKLSSDPGGKLPGWVANMTATDIPLNTLIKMKELLEK